MCGIVYAKRNDSKPVQKSLLKRYRNQSKRGTSGFGYIAVKDGRVTGVKRSTTENAITKMLRDEDSDEILFHHRLPTSTPNLRDCSHPIVVKNDLLKYDYYFVHNGVISNEDKLRADHEDLGFEYTTIVEKITTVRTQNETNEVIEEYFNDSEAAAIDLALTLEGVQTEMQARGSIAFICLQTDKEGNIINIFYGRNTGNPLVVERDKGSKLFFLKSEGHGHTLDPDKVVQVCYDSGDVHVIDMKVGSWYYGKNTTGTKSHYGFNADRAKELPDPSDTQTQLPTIDWDEDDLNEGYERYTETLAAEIDRKLTELSEEEEQLISDIAFYNEMIARHDSTDVEKTAYREEKKVYADNLKKVRREILNLECEYEELYNYGYPSSYYQR